MDETDQALLRLLEENARLPTAVLARRLSLSRSTVQDRLSKLERTAIQGYTLRYRDLVAARQITAHVMISVNPKFGDRVVHSLKQMGGLKALHAVSGQYDLIALVRGDTTAEIDAMLDDIGRIQGIERTTSSIVLSTKFDR